MPVVQNLQKVAHTCRTTYLAAFPFRRYSPNDHHPVLLANRGVGLAVDNSSDERPRTEDLNRFSPRAVYLRTNYEYNYCKRLNRRVRGPYATYPQALHSDQRTLPC